MFGTSSIPNEAVTVLDVEIVPFSASKLPTGIPDKRPIINNDSSDQTQSQAKPPYQMSVLDNVPDQAKFDRYCERPEILRSKGDVKWIKDKAQKAGEDKYKTASLEARDKARELARELYPETQKMWLLVRGARRSLDDNLRNRVFGVFPDAMSRR